MRMKPPTLPQWPMTDAQFVVMVEAELARARAKFPGSNATHAALVEEVGEVAKALMYEPWSAVVGEAIQVAVMAQRLAVEGDDTMAHFRDAKVHQHGRRYVGAEFQMPGPGPKYPMPETSPEQFNSEVKQ